MGGLGGTRMRLVIGIIKTFQNKLIPSVKKEEGRVYPGRSL